MFSCEVCEEVICIIILRDLSRRCFYIQREFFCSCFSLISKRSCHLHLSICLRSCYNACRHRVIAFYRRFVRFYIYDLRMIRRPCNLNTGFCLCRKCDVAAHIVLVRDVKRFHCLIQNFIDVDCVYGDESEYRIAVSAVFYRDRHYCVFIQCDDSFRAASGIMIGCKTAQFRFVSAVHGIIDIHRTAAPEVIASQHNRMLSCRECQIIGDGNIFVCPISVGIQRCCASLIVCPCVKTFRICGQSPCIVFRLCLVGGILIQQAVKSGRCCPDFRLILRISSDRSVTRHTVDQIFQIVRRAEDVSLQSTVRL